ncbi:MerR family transcriptional regulator [Altericroceibacterium endophyticum]|uniref:MerR family transcriptional regulator n=1 Tax=Altericroceibacterium endophyticum TaxID=1808508 RepID=A0A6I4SZZ4_9SPHN|nr:MerR family transcriptional regulator [Altericroceibacterium endophyticum]MXO64277.1 MerR family transcriptional regulator [Altericroceibacterium endophyticum]
MIEFNDGKDSNALRTIGEVARALNIKPHVLRYWEEQFPALKPLKRGGNRRYYRPEDVTLVSEIDRMVNQQGFTLKGARQALDNRTHSGERDVSGASANSVSLDDLKHLRQRIEAALQAC